MVPTSWDPLSKGGVCGGLGPLRTSRGRRRSGWKRSRRSPELHTMAPTFLPAPSPQGCSFPQRGPAWDGVALLQGCRPQVCTVAAEGEVPQAPARTQVGTARCAPGRGSVLCGAGDVERDLSPLRLSSGKTKGLNPCVYLSFVNINLAILEN